MTSRSHQQKHRGGIEQVSFKIVRTCDQDMGDIIVDVDDDYSQDEDDESTRLISRNTKRKGSINSIQSGLPESMPPLPGMQIRCHRLEKNDGTLTHCTTKEALAGAKVGWGKLQHKTLGGLKHQCG